MKYNIASRLVARRQAMPIRRKQKELYVKATSGDANTMAMQQNPDLLELRPCLADREDLVSANRTLEDAELFLQLSVFVHHRIVLCKIFGATFEITQMRLACTCTHVSTDTDSDLHMVRQTKNKFALVDPP
jgi:hypothetical protein